MRYLLPFLSLLFLPTVSSGQDLTSPSENLSISITGKNNTTIKVSYGTDELFTLETGISVAGRSLTNKKGKLGTVTTTDKNETPIVAIKNCTVRNHYRKLTVAFGRNLGLELRAYDSGLAYRFTGLPAGGLTDERFELNFGGPAKLFFPLEDDFISHNERIYPEGSPADFSDKLASTPLLAIADQQYHLWFSEANLQNYPGLWFRAKAGGLTGVHPKRVKSATDKTDRDEALTRYEDYALLAEGAATPWRIIGVAPEAKDLLNNQLVYLLSAPAEGDFSWVHPGMVAWDWYNNLNLTGVDFTTGINNETYEYFIDFAAEYGIPYVVLDEGWSPTTEITTTVADIDLERLVAYGEEKGVGLILWALWKPFVGDLEKTCAQYAEWGIKGVKIDFMQRDDQQMVNHYWDMARVCAENKLLLDLHGAYKPAGLHRTYPNVLTREGVRGLEVYKFGNENSGLGPDHDCTLPFIRQVAGPVDYTPGAMANAQPANHGYFFDRPVSLGTRAHQLAMYVVFESPLQMLADSPTAYEAEPEIPRFIAEVPTVWKQTLPLHGAVGDYVVVAREALNGDWYIGALNDWDARELEIKLDFLPAGDYQMEVFRDGPNHERHAEDYRREVVGATSGQSLVLPLGKGGGWVARLRRR